MEESIATNEIESIDRMLDRYTNDFEIDELNEDESHQILYDRISNAYHKVKPVPTRVDPKKLELITTEEYHALKELIDALIEIFEESGITFEELNEFNDLCRFYKRLVPTWKGPMSLNVKLRYYRSIP